MNIRSFLFIVIVISCFTFSICAQKSVPRFTSTYTSLGAGCKTLRGGGGQDDAFICKGPGGYQIRVYSSAMTTEIVAELKGANDNFHIATVSLAFNQTRSTVEWRLANGKPFAAILRVPKYAERKDGEAGLGKVVGSQMVVTGLSGFDNLKTSIDAKRAGANSLAREAADSEYLSKK